MAIPLQDGERLILETRPHWSAPAGRAAAAVVALAAAAAAGFVWSPDRGNDAVDLAAGAVALLFALRFALALLRHRATWVLVTDRRIVVSAGLRGRAITSVPLARVGGVTFRRGLAGALLGYGTIVLRPLWDEGESRLERMPRPRRVQRIVAGVLTDAPEPEVAPDEEDTGPLPRVIV